jgi:Spy/CpxP family protein refolding chaperone
MTSLLNSALCAFYICLAFSALSIAADEPKPPEKTPAESSDSSKHCKWEKCQRGLKLSEEQKVKMREAFFKFRENKIHIKESKELAKLNYQKIMADPSSDIKAAKAAAQELAEHISKMAAVKMGIRNEIIFQILTPEQRKERSLNWLFMEKSHGHKSWNEHKGSHHNKLERVSIQHEEHSESDDALKISLLESDEDADEETLD